MKVFLSVYLKGIIPGIIPKAGFLLFSQNSRLIQGSYKVHTRFMQG
jgi:hypothetical protein